MGEVDASGWFPRERYMDKLRASRDTPFIKVITGIRRCGKSTLMNMFIRELMDSGVPRDRIVHIDFDIDSPDTPRDHSELTALVESQLTPGKGTYLFFDEVQNVKGWEVSVASFYAEKADVYVTGSNSQMLSSELATKLSGRCLEIHVSPLSFSEYRIFRHGSGKDDADLFDDYIRDGSLPAVALLEDSPAKGLIPETLDGTYSTVFLKDVIGRHDLRNPTMLNNIVRFMMRNIGDRTSARNTAGYMTGAGLKVSHTTVEEYISYVTEAFLMVRSERIDSKTKEYLLTTDKFYATDLGIRNRVAGFRVDDIDGILENVVHNELLYRYGNAAVCAVGRYEVDFVSETADGPAYFQVSMNIGDADTRERELRPLMALDDNYPKTIIVYDRFPLRDIDGVRVVGIVDWLTEMDLSG